MKWARSGAKQAQRLVGQPLIVVVPRLSWRERFLEPHEEDTDSTRSVAWRFLAGQPRVGRPAGQVSPRLAFCPRHRLHSPI
jgi:hypothetical protein